MAVERVFGAETVWHCEIDPAASKVLTHRWPSVPNHRDLINTDWATVEPIDVLCAGWPCQPFSLAGKRKGADDDRAIWPHIADAVRILRPRIVCLENVSAVLRSEFQRVADSLAALGYDLRWTCLRASDVGAPHRRERLFVVAYADSGGFAELEERDSEPQPGLATSQRRDTLRRGDAAPLSGDGPVELLPTPAARDCKGHGPAGMRRNSPNMSAIGDLLPTPNASDGTGGGQHPERREGHSQQLIDEVLAPEQWGKYEPAIRRWEHLTRPAPAPTEPNKNGNPRLSAAFSEWMLGWPDGWVTDVPGISRNDMLRIIGNGVVDRCAEAALRYLLSVTEVAA